MFLFIHLVFNHQIPPSIIPLNKSKANRKQPNQPNANKTNCKTNQQAHKPRQNHTTQGKQGSSKGNQKTDLPSARRLKPQKKQRGLFAAGYLIFMFMQSVLKFFPY